MKKLNLIKIQDGGAHRCIRSVLFLLVLCMDLSVCVVPENILQGKKHLQLHFANHGFLHLFRTQLLSQQSIQYIAMTGPENSVRAMEGDCEYKLTTASVLTLRMQTVTAPLTCVTVKCRPIYLRREFTVVMITVVYNPPDANTKSALGYLYDAISSQQSLQAVHIIAGDFNHAELKAVLPKFHHYVRCATRGANIQDRVYSIIKQGYRAKALSHLGQFNHLSLLLILAYTTPQEKCSYYIQNC